MPIPQQLPIFHFVVQRPISDTIHGELAGVDFQRLARALASVFQDVDDGEVAAAD